MMNQLFYIAVCDDTRTDKEKITEMANDICKEEWINPEISGFDSAEKLLYAIRNGKRYDLLLIDVLMPDQDGIELARTLRSLKENAAIVFISSNREMALQGYEVSAARYLAKPLDREKLKEAILFCYRQQQEKRDIFLPVNSSMRRIAPEEIYYIEIAGKKCRIQQEKEEWYARVSIGKLEEMLSGQGFVRCHQSFLVNCRYVRSFRSSAMELTDGRSIPVSKHRLKETRNAFFKYMNQ